ncbi:MAG: type II toxin-antitoxin system HicB family antitoxin [Actinomycetota bacterium]
MTPGYPINLFWSEDDRQWIAVAPDLEGCSASGDTPEAAAREIQTAMELWLASAQDHGDPIPRPRHYKAV